MLVYGLMVNYLYHTIRNGALLTAEGSISNIVLLLFEQTYKLTNPKHE